MSFIKRIFRRKPPPIEAAAQHLITFNHLLRGIEEAPPDEEERHELARMIFMIGAVDCASQAFKLSEREFAELAKLFYHTIGIHAEYGGIVFESFLRMDSLPNVRTHIIDGGRCFAQWLKGNTMVVVPAANSIKKAASDSAFPRSPGHLYVLLHPGKKG